MRFILVFLFMCSSVYAQDFTKQYITSAGDTIIPKRTKVRIGRPAAFHYVAPNYYDANKGIISGSRIEAKKAHLATKMIGKEYVVTRLNRIKVKKGEYEYILAFDEYDANIQKLQATEYVVYIENALKDGEIEVVK